MNEPATTETGEMGKSRGLLKSSGVVSGMTMLSRIFGLVRDMVIAYYFGASAGADTFFLAFRIPNFFRRLFGEGAFSQAFVPVLSEYRTKRAQDHVQELVDKVSGTLGLNLLVLTIVGVAGAHYIIGAFAAGYVYHGQSEKLVLATDMLRLTFPYLMLISLTAFSAGILNSYGRFAVPAITPVLLNLSLILCAIFLRPWLHTPVMALAWAVLIAGILQLGFQLPFLSRLGLMPRPKVDVHDEGVRKILKLMVPAIFGVSVGQVNLLVDTVLASFLVTGSLSWLYYSDRLMELPLALFGITIGTVILPSLSREHAAESREEFGKTLDWAMRMVILVGTPAAVALVTLSKSLITTLFFQGEMTRHDVTMSSLSLMAFGVGLPGHMLVKVLAPGYFSRQDTATPVRYGITAMVSNILLNLIFIWHLKHAGLALATSLSAFLNAGLLWRGLARREVFIRVPGWTAFLGRVAIANLAMWAFLFLLSPDMSAWFDMRFWQRLVYMLLICGGGALTYGASLKLTGFRFKEMVR